MPGSAIKHAIPTYQIADIFLSGPSRNDIAVQTRLVRPAGIARGGVPLLDILTTYTKLIAPPATIPRTEMIIAAYVFTTNRMN